MASLMSICSDDVTKLELPFQDQASFCTVGNTLIHLVKCSTEWGNKRKCLTAYYVGNRLIIFLIIQ